MIKFRPRDVVIYKHPYGEYRYGVVKRARFPKGNATLIVRDWFDEWNYYTTVFTSMLVRREYKQRRV